jgi:hypothetical protein
MNYYAEELIIIRDELADRAEESKEKLLIHASIAFSDLLAYYLDRKAELHPDDRQPQGIRLG